MVEARIYQPAKPATQSGIANIQQWYLEFEPEQSTFIDPLMGWTGSSDMNQQLRMKFSSKDEAIAYATKHNLEFTIKEPEQRKIKPKSYSDNFK